MSEVYELDESQIAECRNYLSSLEIKGIEKIAEQRFDIPSSVLLTGRGEFGYSVYICDGDFRHNGGMINGFQVTKGGSVIMTTVEIDKETDKETVRYYSVI